MILQSFAIAAGEPKETKQPPAAAGGMAPGGGEADKCETMKGERFSAPQPVEKAQSALSATGWQGVSLTNE
jgi:hypothetical protein